MDHRTEILDLRTALEVLRQTPGQLVETDVEVDPAAELSGVYRYVGAGGTVMRPTKVDGPAMVFHNIKGHPDTSVAIGVLASGWQICLVRKRKNWATCSASAPKRPSSRW